MQLNEQVFRPALPPHAVAPAAPAAVPLQATRVRHLGLRQGAPEWLVQFRPRAADPHTLAAQFTRISIAGTPAAQVRQVQVHAREDVVFLLESLEDQRLHRSTAGEILQAMSSMKGLAGMCMSPVDLGCTLSPQDTMVQLHLSCPDLAGVMRVRVFAA